MRVILLPRSIVLVLFFTSIIATASTTEPSNKTISQHKINNTNTVVTLSQSAQAFIQNNQIDVTLYQQHRNSDLTRLITQLNTTLQQALTLAKKYPNVTLTTGNVNYLPIFPAQTTNQTLSEQPVWQGRITLNLHSTDLQQASQLLAELQQQHLLIENISYSASDNDREKMEQQLIPKAIDALKQQANTVAYSLNKKVFNINSINLSQYHSVSTPFLLRSDNTANSNSDNTENLPLQPGKSQISITVTAKIMLK